MINKELLTMIDVAAMPRIKRGITKAIQTQRRFRMMVMGRISIFGRIRSGGTVANIGFFFEVSSDREVF